MGVFLFVSEVKNREYESSLNEEYLINDMKKALTTESLAKMAHTHVWPEIIAGQRAVGIIEMQIYRHGLSLFMIMDTVDEFDFARDMARLAVLPRQAEWEAYVAQFQGAKVEARSDEKWQMMERIF